LTATSLAADGGVDDHVGDVDAGGDLLKPAGLLAAVLSYWQALPVFLEALRVCSSGSTHFSLEKINNVTVNSGTDTGL
jgi:hypothetical protein